MPYAAAASTVRTDLDECNASHSVFAAQVARQVHILRMPAKNILLTLHAKMEKVTCAIAGDDDADYHNHFGTKFKLATARVRPFRSIFLMMAMLLGQPPSM